MAKPVAGASRLLPLATALAAMLGTVPPGSASAATLLVTDCTDGPGSGTLRNTIAAAPDSSTIEIPLACSTITLTQGDIVISPSITDMTIVGQGPAATTIDAGSRAKPAVYGRAFNSQQLGVLYLSHLTIAHAKYTGSAFPRGGCIYAKNDVYLTDVVITDCRSAPLSGSMVSKGGAVYSRGYVSLNQSVVSNSVAANASTQGSLGGGIFATTGILATFSTIADNVALGDVLVSRGGGIYSAGGDVTLFNSTISGNRSDFNSAVEAHDSGNNYFSATSSTISGNSSNHVQTVGAYMKVHFFDSTLAFNHVQAGNTSAPAGLYSNHQIRAYSSIFAENDSQTGPANDVYSNVLSNPLIGSNLLITATSNPVPLGTRADCPRLGHLSNNGGPTLTIPLLAGSPAIDTGAPNSQSYDQRGTGFPRILGAAADIGAFERQPGAIDDIVFFSGFQTGCN